MNEEKPQDLKIRTEMIFFHLSSFCLHTWSNYV